jgi:hypothetical protein
VGQIGGIGKANPFFPDALPMSQSGQNEKQKTCLRYSQQQQITVTIM